MRVAIARGVNRRSHAHTHTHILCPPPLSSPHPLAPERQARSRPPPFSTGPSRVAEDDARDSERIAAHWSARESSVRKGLGCRRGRPRHRGAQRNFGSACDSRALEAPRRGPRWRQRPHARSDDCGTIPSATPRRRRLRGSTCVDFSASGQPPEALRPCRGQKLPPARPSVRGFGARRGHGFLAAGSLLGGIVCSGRHLPPQRPGLIQLPAACGAHRHRCSPQVPHPSNRRRQEGNSATAGDNFLGARSRQGRGPRLFTSVWVRLEGQLRGCSLKGRSLGRNRRERHAGPLPPHFEVSRRRYTSCTGASGMNKLGTCLLAQGLF